jgi:gentisate 1,2-dioxygenase
MDEYINAYEYEKNVNPTLNSIPLYEKNINECNYGITFIDFSNLFNINYKSTTPNLLASFIKLNKDKDINLQNNYQSDDINYENNFVNGTSHLFYIMQGICDIKIDDEQYSLLTGDILITPFFNSLTISNKNEDELQIYYINDSPLVNYLGNKPIKKIFKTAIYSKDFLLNNLHSLSNSNNNRKGILLSNKDTNKIGTNTITPVLWALYNELPPNTVQKPHKHNSVALDLCINCSDSENIYTLLGDEIDDNGYIINPTKINWKQGGMFITPPGLWHSHNNIGNTYAYILPIQDAGLLLYQRILGIVLKK